MKWQEYQEAVGQLYERIEGFASVQKNITIPDKITGQARQVDVWIEFEVKTHKIGMLIDAKFRQDKLDVKDIEEIYALGTSVGANKVIIVASNGWTRPAKIKADFIGMDLRILTIENALDILSPDKWFICPICLADFIGLDFLGGLILNEMISIVTAGRCYGCNGAYINCQACGLNILLKENEEYLCECEHSWKATKSSIQVKPHGLGEYRLIVSNREPHQYLETDLQWLLSNAQSLRNEGEYSKSFEIVQEALSLYSVDSSILLEKALTLDAMGKREEALTTYDQAIELDSSQPSAFLSRGLLHLFLHNWELCIRDFDTYLSADDPINIGDLYRVEKLRDFAKTKLQTG